MTLAEKPLLYTAVAGYHRWWVHFDRKALAAMVDRDRPHTSSTIRSIATAYNVNRWIYRSRTDGTYDADPNGGRLAELLNAEAANWRAMGFLERARACIRLAERACALELTRNLQVSAMTKLMWFVEPSNWTVFDRFAAGGLGIGYGSTEERSRKFYESLQSRHFEQVAAAGNGHLSENGLGHLRAERVLDQFLMLSAYDPNRLAKEMAGLDVYLAAKESKERAAIRLAADALVAALGVEPLGSLKSKVTA